MYILIFIGWIFVVVSIILINRDISDQFRYIIVFIALMCLIIALLMSIHETKNIKEVKPKYINIVKGKDAIYVETELRDFKLTNISQLSILTGKNIKVVYPINHWGIPLDDKIHLEWE